MTRFCLLLLPLLALPALAQQRPASPAPLPLVVERVEVAPSGIDPIAVGSTGVTIFNAGLRTIHAFGILKELTFADGKTNRGGLATDRYERPERRPPREDPLRGDCDGALEPGRRCTVWIGATSRTDVVSATAAVRFVIFDDNTAAGDEQEIDWYFRQRALNHRAWPIIEQIVLDAMARESDPLLALHEVQEALGRVHDPDVRASGAFGSFSRGLMLNLKIPGLDHAAFLAATLQDVRTRRARAEQHYRRRP